VRRLRQIEPANPRIRTSRNDVGGVIGASIADDEQFEVTAALSLIGVSCRSTVERL
jgi:hypothetical protein